MRTDVGSGPGTITVDLRNRVPRAGCRIDREPEVSRRRRAAAARPASTPSTSRSATPTRSGYATAPSTSFTRTRCYSTSPFRRGAARDAAGLAPGGWSPPATPTTPATWSPDDPRLDALARPVPRGRPKQPWRAGCGRRLKEWARAPVLRVDAGASVWCFASDANHTWWGGVWSERVVASAFAEQAVERGFATRPGARRHEPRRGERGAHRLTAGSRSSTARCSVATDRPATFRVLRRGHHVEARLRRTPTRSLGSARRWRRRSRRFVSSAVCPPRPTPLTVTSLDHGCRPARRSGVPLRLTAPGARVPARLSEPRPLCAQERYALTTAPR